jgi:hypothetical protein
MVEIVADKNAISTRRKIEASAAAAQAEMCAG